MSLDHAEPESEKKSILPRSELTVLNLPHLVFGSIWLFRAVMLRSFLIFFELGIGVVMMIVILNSHYMMEYDGFLEILSKPSSLP